MDNSHKSSCPICQRWFMVLFLKSEAKELALTVFPVNMKNPEPEFKEYHATPPVVVLVQENIALTDNLRIEQYITSRFTSLDLTSSKEAEVVCSDVYIKFNAYLKTVDQSVQAKERQLLIELKRINDFLETNGTQFLSGNEITLIDCDIMPKLQHIRVAGKVKRKSNWNVRSMHSSINCYFLRLTETSRYQLNSNLCGDTWPAATRQKHSESHVHTIKTSFCTMKAKCRLSPCVRIQRCNVPPRPFRSPNRSISTKTAHVKTEHLSQIHPSRIIYEEIQLHF